MNLYILYLQGMHSTTQPNVSHRSNVGIPQFSAIEFTVSLVYDNLQRLEMNNKVNRKTNGCHATPFTIH